MISIANSNPPPPSCTQIQIRNGNAVTTGSELIQTTTTTPPPSTLGSRIIPKIGAIVKRFSLNYSGEGLVSDPNRVRTVRVGIRFQVQVDSFLNNNANPNSTPAIRGGPQQIRPRGITRTYSAPHSIDTTIHSSNCDSSSEYYSSTTTTPSITDISTNNNRQFVIERSTCGGSPVLHRNFTSVGNLSKESVHTLNSSDIELDSSSGVSSLGGSNPQSPLNSRRHSSSLTFHNRINQALSLCRDQLTGGGGGDRRRNSVQVYRRASSACHSPERSPISSLPPSNRSSGVNMEDSSSYQILRCFPGSNVNSVREFSWETAAFEKDVREKVQWLGSKFSSVRVPPFVHSLLGAMRSYAMENPVTAVFILAVALASLLPVSIFLGFAIATVLVSFLGFLFVEGTLLTVASITFGGVILVVGLVTLMFALLGSAGYLTTSKIYSFFTGKELSHLFHLIPIIGQFFKREDEQGENIVSPASSKRTPNGSPFKLSNGENCPPSSTFSYSEDDEEDEDDEENVEVVDTDNNDDDETDDNGSVTSSESDGGIGDSTSLEVDHDLKSSLEKEDSLDLLDLDLVKGQGQEQPPIHEDEVKVSPTIPVIQFNGHHADEIVHEEIQHEEIQHE